jgi:kynurenine formamidase
MSPTDTPVDLVSAVQDGRIVDLSLTLAEDLPCTWATHMPFQVKPWNWFEDDPDALVPLRAALGPYFTRWLIIDEHVGTHFDAPRHFIPPDNDHPERSRTAERIPVEQFFGPAVVIRVPWREQNLVNGESAPIGPRFIEDWEGRNGRIAAGSVVIFATGWDDHYTVETGSRYSHEVIVTGTAPGWPAPTVETVSLLLERGVACMGSDAPSVAPAESGQPLHLEGLGNGMVFLEGLASVTSLPEAGAYFLFLPLKIKGGSGAPGRALAILPAGTDG